MLQGSCGNQSGGVIKFPKYLLIVKTGEDDSAFSILF